MPTTDSDRELQQNRGASPASAPARGSALWGTLLGDMSPARVLTHYKTLLIDTCEQDTSVRKIASEVLTDFEINGDSYGVPGIEDIVETLVRRVKAPGTRGSETASYELFNKFEVWTNFKTEERAWAYLFGRPSNEKERELHRECGWGVRQSPNGALSGGKQAHE